MKNNRLRLGFSLIELSIVILIIGILVIGITKGSRILSESKLKSARSLTSNSPVALNADNLAFWLETTSEKSFDSSEAGNNAAVTNWRDINPSAIGGGFNVTQATQSNKPLYIKTAVNGLPSLRFDGNDWLERANTRGSELNNSQNQLTIFIVQKYASPAHNGAAIFWNIPGANTKLGVHGTWGDGHFLFDFQGGAGLDRIDVDLNSLLGRYMNKTNIISGVRRANGSGDLRINGTSYGARTLGTLSTSLNPFAVATFDISRYNYGEFYQTGDFNEIILFKTALRDSEIIEIEKYLSTKWGVALKGL